METNRKLLLLLTTDREEINELVHENCGEVTCLQVNMFLSHLDW